MKCDRSVADYTGWHFHKCGREVKWHVVGIHSKREHFVCGLHSRSFRSNPDSYIVKIYKEQASTPSDDE